MRVVETVWAAYRLLFANLGAFLRTAVRWALLATILAIVSGTSRLADQGTLVYITPYLLTLFVSTAGSICLAIVWHRFVILGEPATRFFPADRDVVGPYVVRATIAMAAPIAFFETASATFWDAEDGIAVDAAVHGTTALLLAAFARFVLVLPAAAVGDRETTFKVSWQATRGRSLAIFVGLLACDLPLTAAIVGIDYATKDHQLYELEGIAAFALMQVLDLARNAIWTIFASYAYLEFANPTRGQADHFA